MDQNAGDGLDVVAFAYAGAIRRRPWNDVPGRNTLRRVEPRNTVIGKNEPGTLLEVQGRENDSRERNEGQYNCPEPRSEVLVHP